MALPPPVLTLPTPPAFPVFLLRWLLFRFMLFSGVVKLASGDPSWRDLTALSYHYFTQPLPSPLSWFFAQAPLWFHRGCAGYLFAVELVFPFFIFGNNVMRRIAFAGFASLQLVILATGNLSFLNWLTLILALTLLDDGCFAAVMPNELEAALTRPFRVARTSLARQIVIFGLGGFLLLWSVLTCFDQIGWFDTPPAWLTAAEHYIDPWRSVNGYGLFAVMTKTRNEISIEGSDDGTTWLPYGFRYKPGDPKKMPGYVAPWQPRLDWQMWFAALGDASGDKMPWFPNLLVRLLQGSPDVLRLFAKNPFPDHPPHFVRAQLYSYRFTTRAERAATGNWWKIDPAGSYYPAIMLNKATAADATP